MEDGMATDEKEPLRRTLEYYRQQRQQKLDELRPIETMIRQLERDLGEAPSLADVGNEVTTAAAISGSSAIGLIISPMFSLRPDEFYGMSQSEAAKAYLRKVGRAIPFDELVQALRKGGAKLGGADPKKTLYVSLARNPRKEFVWPSTDHISLSEFYDRAK
jgi:hypothetical protein